MVIIDGQLFNMPVIVKKVCIIHLKQTHIFDALIERPAIYPDDLLTAYSVVLLQCFNQ